MVASIRTVIITLFVLLYSVFAIAATSVETSVDRDKVYMGNSLQLSYTIQGDTQFQPNLDPLRKDFTIVGTGTQQQLSIVNGRSTALTKWLISLSPKHTGKVVIPSIRFGNALSKPVTIEVVAAAKAEPGDAVKNVFLKASIDPKSPYVQSQGTYTLELFYDQQVQDPRLSPPNHENVEFIHLGNDRLLSKAIENRNYHVIERRYAIIPKTSGNIILDGPVFTGRTLTTEDLNPGGRRLYSTSWQPIQVTANSIDMQVKAMPKQAKGQWWLPAKSVTISETWSEQPNKFIMGQPITRTISMEAVGLAAEQLPNLDDLQIDHFHIYPDKAKLSTDAKGNDIIGKRVEKFALIPNQTGKLTIPEVRIPWWNTKTNKQEYAVIPAKTINVAVNPQYAGSAQQGDSASGAVATASQITDAGLNNQNNEQAQQSDSNLKGVVIILLILWLATMLFWWYNKHMKDKPRKFKSKVPDWHQAFKALQLSCRNNNAKQAKSDLIEFANHFWQDANARSLGEIKKYTKQEQTAQAIDELDKHLYTGNPKIWVGKPLQQSINLEVKNRKHTKKDGPEHLERMYPDQ